MQDKMSGQGPDLRSTMLYFKIQDRPQTYYINPTDEQLYYFECFVIPKPDVLFVLPYHFDEFF